MTAPWEQVSYEPMTPSDSEKQLRWVLRAMYDAQRTLAELRDFEVGCKHDYERARRHAHLSPDCPRPARGATTVADRDAWVDERCSELRERFEMAVAHREAAQDHLRTLNGQSVVMSALAKNVQQTYAVVGAR